ncbi:MAG: hypothetical protein V4625_02160 [Pseudomonadota bacterium]
MAIVAAGCAALIGWKNAPVGQLVWDGQSWRWELPAYQTGISEQNISVMADFQHLMLLRMQDQAGHGMCIWCERQAFPERWLDFRRAIFSPGRPAGLPAVAVSGHANAAAMRVKP